MPGVYAKTPSGERFQDIKNLVTSIDQHIDQRNWEAAMILDFPLLRLQLADLSKATVEDFCYAGGFQLLYRFLHLRSSNGALSNATPDPIRIDIVPVLELFTSLLAVEHDPYDDDLQTLPLLDYFLCERHTHYVDISWNFDELELMEGFIRALGQVITAPVDTDIAESTRIQAVQVLHGALLSFPPHRAVPKSGSAFSEEFLQGLFDGLRRLRSLWTSAEGRRLVARLILSIAYFGLGIVIAADVPFAQLLISVNSFICPELRCRCHDCEFPRRVVKNAKERDEFGVVAATESKRRIPHNLVKAGVVPFLSELIEASFNAAESEVDFTESSLSNNTPEIWKSREKAGAARIPSDAELRLRYRCDLHVYTAFTDGLHLDNKTSEWIVNDETSYLSTLTLCLCSWAYTQVYDRSILSDNSYGCLVALLKNLPVKNIRPMFHPLCGELLPGVRTSIETLGALIFQASDTNSEEDGPPGRSERQEVLRRVKPTFEVVTAALARSFSEAAGPLGETWEPHMASFIPLLTALLASIYGTGMNCNDCSLMSSTRIGRSARKSDRAGSMGPFEACPEVFLTSVEALDRAVDGFVRRGSSIHPKVFTMVSFQGMALLTRCPEYNRCPELRRRIFPLADPRVGFICSAVRDLIEQLQKAELLKEGCTAIRTLSSLALGRAEKATAVVLYDSGGSRIGQMPLRPEVGHGATRCSHPSSETLDVQTNKCSS